MAVNDQYRRKTGSGCEINILALSKGELSFTNLLITFIKKFERLYTETIAFEKLDLLKF